MVQKIKILEPAHEYIQGLKYLEQGAIKAQIEAMRVGNFESVRTKQLRGKIRELIFGKHRITYFQASGELYFIRGFLKKSNKTPKREIEYAEKIYKRLNK